MGADELLAAGARLLAERGIEGVNSNQIARAAGVGVGTFYAHFKDKHALHQRLVLSALDALRQAVEVAVAAAPDEPEAQVRALVEATLAFAEDDPARFRAAFQREHAAGTIRGGVGPSARGVERRLRALQEEGSVDPNLHPAVAARAFASMQTGVILWWLDDRARAARQELVETLVRLHPALRRPR